MISEVIMIMYVGLGLLFYVTYPRIIALKRTSLIDKRYVVKGLIWFNGVAPILLTRRTTIQNSPPLLHIL